MNRHIAKGLLFVGLVFSGVYLLRSLDAQLFQPAIIREYILSFGWIAPLVYIFLYTIRPLFFFPAVILSLAGGLTFGPWWGTFFDLIGATLGSFLAFGAARKLGRETMEKWTRGRLGKLDIYMNEQGFKAILFLRLIPLVPFDAVNYGAGLTRIRFRDYALATPLGILPGAFAYNYLGASLHQVFSPMFFMAIALVIALMIIPAGYKRWNRKTTNMVTMEGRRKI
ncbi:TVP38/TMEM64 family protein [Ammoniphilus sp. CFH 90114]|uniref:TVP38/TMEM64 family protein n=1 Tax=Ammoniphilus sp. CFH 90114 TaxID=2493665 RepID=UPI0013E99247|nr:TVP38/TMEM64 family protein [Ammoniphilus sp. CFH 90114]